MAGETARTPNASARNVSVTVTGANPRALIKTVVVTDNGKETGDDLMEQELPYNVALTVPSDGSFTKILVLAKYPSGATADIACSITVDGNEVASDSSQDHEPAECLFLAR